jgi:rhodanese-related sulfurtransferase
LPPATGKKRLFQVLFGCLFIGLLSVAMGLGLNFLRASPLPLVPPYLWHSSEEKIDSDQAQKLAREGNILFLDSRNHLQYKKAHLPGALNLPVKDFSALYPALTPLLPPNGWIVIYGEGWGRPTERELAYLLGQAGEKKIKILDGGFRAWAEKGYPVKGR